MNEHVDTATLERVVLEETSLGEEELGRIRRHVSGCAICREEMQSLEAMYRKVEKELEGQPTDRDRAVASRIVPRGVQRRTPEERIVEADADVIEPYKRPVTGKILRFIRMHPYRSSGAVLVAAAGIALLFTVLTPRKDQNPTYAEIKNYVLTSYNKEAEVIWKKGVPGMPDWTSRTPQSLVNDYPKRHLQVEDVDGDRVNEILLVGSSLTGEYTNDTLYCFAHNGDLRWKTGVGPMISFGKNNTNHHNRAQIVDFLVMRKSSNLPVQLFVLANEQIYSPTKVFEVRGADGTILQSYFNRGGCAAMLHKDIDIDGKEELLLGGINDGFNRGCLAVLDPANLEGVSPVPQDETRPEGSKGKEMYYLLFPRWKLGQQSGKALYGIVRYLIDPQAAGIDVADNEMFLAPDKYEVVYSALIFNLGPTLAVDRVMADDTIIRWGDILLKEGKIRSRITSDTYSSLKDSVLYWDGNRFVHTPTMNKHYETDEPRIP